MELEVTPQRVKRVKLLSKVHSQSMADSNSKLPNAQDNILL